MDDTIPIPYVEPYDFPLSVSATQAFQPDKASPEERLRLPARIGAESVVVEVWEENEGRLVARSNPGADRDHVRSLVQWVLFADLDLAPFYEQIDGDDRVSPVVERLHGLKPTRPVSLFEMAVIAITEQQLSLASAYRIRERLVQRFGEPVEDLWVFPEPGALAEASIDELRSVGLSRQKADYILVRGLARPDAVPSDDLGIRDVVGAYLGEGARVTATRVEELLEPFRPYRGLLAFYLLVHQRLAGGPA